MKLIFTSYISSQEYDQPDAWLKRIEAYTGILESLSHHHTVIGIERINYEGQHQQNGVKYFFVRFKKRVARFPLAMHRLIRILEPDIVFINGFIFPLQILQLKLTLGKKVKIVVLHRAERPFKGIKRYLQQLADKCVDAYLFTSLEFGDVWKHNINSKKIHEVIQASSVFQVMDRGVARAITKVEGRTVYLWVGRLDANKDPVTAIAAFLKFLKDQPQARLYIIHQSDDLLSQVKKIINSDDKISGSVRLVGKVPHPQMQQWYNSANFIIASSHYEGGGTAVSEAMSCGCIPLVTNIASFRKMTGPGKCGFLFDPGNEKELLDILLRTKELDINAEREKVLRQFNDELSFDAIAKKIKGIIETLK